MEFDSIDRRFTMNLCTELRTSVIMSDLSKLNFKRKIKHCTREELFTPNRGSACRRGKRSNLQYMCNDILLAATQETHYRNYSGVTLNWMLLSDDIWLFRFFGGGFLSFFSKTGDSVLQ